VYFLEWDNWVGIPQNNGLIFFVCLFLCDLPVWRIDPIWRDALVGLCIAHILHTLEICFRKISRDLSWRQWFWLTLQKECLHWQWWEVSNIKKITLVNMFGTSMVTYKLIGIFHEIKKVNKSVCYVFILKCFHLCFH